MRTCKFVSTGFNYLERFVHALALLPRCSIFNFHSYLLRSIVATLFEIHFGACPSSTQIPLADFLLCASRGNLRGAFENHSESSRVICLRSCNPLLSVFQIGSAERFIFDASRSRSAARARRRTEGRDEASTDHSDGGRSAKVKGDEEEEEEEIRLENSRPLALLEGMWGR